MASKLYDLLMKKFGTRTIGEQPGKGEQELKVRRSGRGGPISDARSERWGGAARAAAMKEDRAYGIW